MCNLLLSIGNSFPTTGIFERKEWILISHTWMRKRVFFLENQNIEGKDFSTLIKPL